MLRLLPCAALVAVAMLPACQPMQCYQCADITSALKSSGDDSLSEGLGGLLGGIVNLVMPPCNEFDPSLDKYKRDCPPPTDDTKKQHCTKTSQGDMTFRGCQERDGNPGCITSGDTTLCYCAGELCNGGAAALPGLLLLLPAALALLRL